MIENLLDKLWELESEYQSEIDICKANYEGDLVDLLGDDLYQAMVKLQKTRDASMALTEENFQPEIKELQDEIKTETLQHGASVKANHYMAVFAQPKPVWDNGKLEGYALVHPEILECRTPKPPYVSLRKVK